MPIGRRPLSSLLYTHMPSLLPDLSRASPPHSSTALPRGLRISSEWTRSRLSARGRAGILLVGLAVLVGISGGTFGCAGDGRSSRATPPVGAPSINGLQLARSTKHSLLWVKPDHHLGRYDDVIVHVAGFLYADDQRPLDPAQEDEVSQILAGALAGITANGPVGIAETPGPCVVVVNIGLKDLRLHTTDTSSGGSSSSFVSSFGSATLVVEFRDSVSGTPLLRYMAARGLGGGPGTGRSGANLARLGQTLGEIVTEMVDELATIVPSTTAKQAHECKDGIYALTGRG